MNKKELERKLEGVFDVEHRYGSPEISVTHDRKQNTLRIRVEQMYEFVNITFDHLEMIAEIIGTKKINIGSRNSSPGCETCDYGSSYVIYLDAKEFVMDLES